MTAAAQISVRIKQSWRNTPDNLHMLHHTILGESPSLAVHKLFSQIDYV